MFFRPANTPAPAAPAAAPIAAATPSPAAPSLVEADTEPVPVVQISSPRR